MHRKNIFITIGLLLILAGLPLMVFISKQSTQKSSHAQAATVLYISPTSTQETPLTYKTGSTVSFAIYMNPGTNLVDYTKLEIQYNPSIFTPTGVTPFSPNTNVFPSVEQTSQSNSGTYLISLSIGSNPTGAISSVTQIGTLTLTAIAPTGQNPTVVSFGPNTQVLSVASTDQSEENVLSTTIPAYVSVIASTSTLPTPTQSPSLTQIPSITPIESPTSGPPTPVPSLTQSAQNGTTLSFTVYLPDIGKFGDSVDPTDDSDSNQNPLHPERSVDAFILNAQNTIIATQAGTIAYNSLSGNFTGNITFPNISSGDYRVSLMSPSYLVRLVPGIQTLGPNDTFMMTPIYLVGGDFNGDNVINILDYNLLIGCYSDLTPASSCTPQMQVLTDLYDAGSVGAVDYNLFLREISVQSGD